MTKTETLHCRITLRTQRQLKALVRYHHTTKDARATRTSVIEDLIQQEFVRIKRQNT